MRVKPKSERNILRNSPKKSALSSRGIIASFDCGSKEGRFTKKT